MTPMRIINPFRIVRQSFRTRIFALLTLLILVTTITFTTFYVLHESNAATERLITEGNFLAGLLAYNSRLAVFAENREMLRETSDGILFHKHVISAGIFNSEGQLLIERNRQPKEGTDQESEEISGTLHDTIIPRLKAEKKSVYYEKADLLEFIAPIIISQNSASPESLYFDDSTREKGEQFVGVARIVLDKTGLAATLHRLLLTSIIMGAMVLIIGAYLMYLVTLGLTRPLSNLMAGVKALDQGELSARIPVESDDELGEVSHAFNTMAHSLEKREAENRYLEELLRRAEKLEAKEEWECTFDTVPDLVAVLDHDHRIVRINKAMADRLGVAKEAAVGTRVYGYLHGTGTPPDDASISALLADGATYFEEIYHEQLSYFMVTISPLARTDGIIGSVYVARDITKRKQAEELLQKAEARFRLIAETIVEVIWMADVDVTKILYISPAYEQVWGRSLESLYEDPRSFIDSVHPDDRDLLTAVLENQGTGAPYELEYRIIRPDGSIRHIWDRGYPVRENTGQVTCYTGVAEDITGHKLAEEEKRAIQAKLVQTNKMTSLGLMVSGLAHEVNNPNNSIKLTAHLLARSWQDILPVLEQHCREDGDFSIGGQSFAQVKEILPQHIAGIRANSRRIEGIIKNLRDFVRKGAADINFKAEINTIVSIAASIINVQIKQYTRHFQLKLDEDVPVVRGNPQQLEQVVINLIMNALQALPDREHAVLVATSFDSAAGLVVIKVVDEGGGMPPDVKERIFEPFFSTKLDQGGTGLGLAISNFIVKEHKGSLEFESEPGKGTTALVKLPVWL